MTVPKTLVSKLALSLNEMLGSANTTPGTPPSDEEPGTAPKKCFQPYHSQSVPKSENLGANAFSRATTGEPITTMMLRNIPNKYTQNTLLQEIDDLGFVQTYDFFYLPMDVHNRSNVGYAFINFVDPVDAERFRNTFYDHRFQRFQSRKISSVCVAHVQGLDQNLRHFENRAVTHARNDQYRPIVLRGNMRVDFEEAVAEVKSRCRSKSSVSTTGSSGTSGGGHSPPCSPASPGQKTASNAAEQHPFQQPMQRPLQKQRPQQQQQAQYQAQYQAQHQAQQQAQQQKVRQQQQPQQQVQKAFYQQQQLHHQLQQQLQQLQQHQQQQQQTRKHSESGSAMSDVSASEVSFPPGLAVDRQGLEDALREMLSSPSQAAAMASLGLMQQAGPPGLGSDVSQLLSLRSMLVDRLVMNKEEQLLQAQAAALYPQLPLALSRSCLFPSYDFGSFSAGPSRQSSATTWDDPAYVTMASPMGVEGFKDLRSDWDMELPEETPRTKKLILGASMQEAMKEGPRRYCHY